MCIRCGAVDDGASAPRFRKCSGCGLAHYCGEACQKLDWKQHKPICARLKSDPMMRAAPKRMMTWFRSEPNMQMVRLVCADVLRGVSATSFVRLTVDMMPALSGGGLLAAICSIEAVADINAATGGDMGDEHDTVSKAREMERRSAGDYNVFVVRFKGEIVLCSTLGNVSRSDLATAFRFLASSPAAAAIMLGDDGTLRRMSDRARGAEVAKQLTAKHVATCLAN